MPKPIGVILAAVAATVQTHGEDLRAVELAYQEAERADLKAAHSERDAAIAEAEAVAVLTGRTVYDPAANKVYRVVNGKIDAVTPDSPEVEVVVPPVDIDGDGEPDNAPDAGSGGLALVE